MIKWLLDFVLGVTPKKPPQKPERRPPLPETLKLANRKTDYYTKATGVSTIGTNIERVDGNLNLTGASEVKVEAGEVSIHNSFTLPDNAQTILAVIDGLLERNALDQFSFNVPEQALEEIKGITHRSGDDSPAVMEEQQNTVD